MASEVAESFQASLDELKFNSKPQISMLTMLAEDNEQFASEIVQVIEEQIKKVAVGRKLPILYLVDSIVKNLPKTIYPHLFEQCIVQIFCGVFEEVDEKTRQSMYKLRQTWVDIIQNKRLYALDVGVHHIDPAWPITASPPEQGVIHVNPKFLKGTKESSSHMHTVNKPSDDISEELHAKERELQKVQQELEQSKKRLEKQELEILHAKSGRKVIDREPPPLIALPPAVTTSSNSSVMSVKSRGPQMSRDPRLNRDPRLRKQLETLDKDVDSSTTTHIPSSYSAVDITTKETIKSQPNVQSQVPGAPRMDLESLINSFTNAATKVAAVQAQKNVFQASDNGSSHKSSSVHKASHNSEIHATSHSSNQKAPRDYDIKTSDAQDNEKISSHSHKNRQSSPHKKIRSPSNQKISGKSNSNDQKSSSPNSEVKDIKIEPKSPRKTSSSEKIHRDPRESKSSPKEANKGARSPDVKIEEKGGKGSGTFKGSKNKSSEKETRGTSLSPRKERSSKTFDKGHPNERSKARSDANNDKRSPRSQFHSSPDKRGGSRERNWDKKRSENPVIHSNESETDQFGHLLHTDRIQSDSKDTYRDRSPIKRERESSRSPRGREQKSQERKEDDSSKNSSEIRSPPTDVKPESDISEAEIAPIMESQVENESPSLQAETQGVDPEKELQESEAEIQDVDMRIAPPVQEKAPCKNEEQSVINEPPENVTMSETEVNAHKRPKSESENANLQDAPSEKRPKLEQQSSLNQETKPAAEDISQLFGEEDVDYRNLNKRPSTMVPPPVPSETLLSPTLKSPAERRWSQFKENHPNDFVHETERKRLRSVQMQEIQDVDMRQQLVSPRQRSLPLPPILDPVEDAPRPKERSVENRDLILQRADKELKEGRMSPGNHRELVRQVEEVYDMPRGRPDVQRPVKNLDLRDPRLRGSHDQGAPSDDSHAMGRTRPKDGKHPPHLPVSPTDVRNGPVPMDRKMPPNLPKSSQHEEINIDNRSPVYEDRDEDLRKGYRRDFESHKANRDVRGRYRNVSQDYDERSPRDFDYDENRSPRDFDDRRPNQFRDFERRPRRKFDADDKGSYYEEDDQHHYEVGRYHEPPYGPRHPGRHDMNDVPHGPRRNSPPLDRSRPQDFDNRRGRDADPAVDIRGHRGSFDGPDGPPKHLDNHPQGRIPSPDHPPFVNKPEGPPRPLPGAAANAPARGPPPPHQNRHRPTPSDKPAISDPLEDPRWAPMRGLLDSGGTEEVVLDDKPFELRMGTSRKLRMYGQIFEVAVDMKERGIRVDGQLVYKLGEPIKEVSIRGRMIRLYYHGQPKPIWLDGQQHEMRIDAPPRNVLVDGAQRGFQIDGRDFMILVDRLEKGKYGGPPRKIRILGIEHDIGFQFPSRQILIDGKPCELKLDSKIPFVIIEGKPHGIRFDGEPKTIFINDQPYTIPLDRAERVRIGPRPTYIAFGGPAHELIIDGKWFEVKFDNMPKDIHLGNRQFSIRIPGPLPRVKILDQMPPNFDVSGLMMSHEPPQPGLPPCPVPPVPPVPPIPTVPQDRPVKAPNQTAKGNEVISTDNTNSNAVLPEKEPPMSSGPPPPVQPDINRILPGIKPNVGNQVPGQNNVPQPARLPGPMQPNRHPGYGNVNQPPRSMMGPNNRGMMPQGHNLLQRQGLGMMPQGVIPPGLLNPNMMPPSGNLIQQPGTNFMQNLMRPHLSGNPMLQQIGLRSSLPNMMAMQANTGMLSQPQPVNLIAQGLLSQISNSMQIAAEIQALSQMSNQNKPDSKGIPTPPVVTASDNHSAAMATGLQGTQNKNLGTTAPNVPTLPSPFLPHLPGMPANLAGNLLTVRPPQVSSQNVTPATSTPLPTSLSSQQGATSTPSSISQVVKPVVPPPSSTSNDSKDDSKPETTKPETTKPETTKPETTKPETTKPETTTAKSSGDIPQKAPIDINNLLSSLLKAGLIKDTSKADEKSTESNKTDTVNETPVEEISKTPIQDVAVVPDMTDFCLDELKIYHESVVNALHEGIQCHTCSARFTEDEQDKYKAHLDWHFRQNKIEQEMVKVAKNRKWFYTIMDWIQYEELEDAEEKFRSEIFEQMKAGTMRGVVVDQLRLRGLEGKDFIKNPVASGIEGEDVCATCGDPFDQMWNEETEEWILKNTIKVDGKTYHPVCYEDIHETPSSSVLDDNKNPFDAAAAEALLLTQKEEEMETNESPVSEEKKINLTEMETKPVTSEGDHQTELTDASSESKSATVSIPLLDMIDTEIKQEPIDQPASSVTESSSVTPERKPEVTSTVCQAPNLLSTIASTVKREVISVTQEDPSSPWEMDSNPTPELSRTPTPEPIISFTPVPSQSSDSITSSITTDIPGLEDPIPPSCTTEANDTLNQNSV